MGYLKSGAEISLRLIGDWEGTVQRMMMLGPDVKKAAMSAQYKVSRKLRTIVMNHLRDQDLNWPALKPETLKRKGHDLILVDTFNSYNNITIWQESLVVFVGVKIGVQEASGLSTSLVATFHEYGTANGRIPRRPLWLPSFNEIGKERGIRDAMAQEMKALLIKMGYSVRWV